MSGIAREQPPFALLPGAHVQLEGGKTKPCEERHLQSALHVSARSPREGGWEL
jgi:hypothetical protein